MNQYFVCILFESHIDGAGEEDALSEESIRFVVANNYDEAREKAARFGRAAEHSYLNNDGERVSWKFVSVMDVQEFCDAKIDDGTEVYSRLNKRERPITAMDVKNGTGEENGDQENGAGKRD